MKKTIITYTSRKNASKVYTLVSSDETNNTAVLTDLNGAEHTMKLTTLRKTFKKSVEEVEVEEPKTEEKPMAKHRKSRSNFVDGERVNLRMDEAEKTVNVRAFTGMLIGTFEVVKETPKTILVKTHKGKMKFDKASGLQLDARNPKFANRIDL